MAHEPDPVPITVEELIARTAEDTAFPRADSLSVRRAATEPSTSTTEPERPTTASGMPAYTPPTAAAPAAPKARVIGASGMPAHTPAAAKPGAVAKPESANVVTGIIPVVTDTGSLRRVESDDLIGEDLPTGANAALVVQPAADIDPTVVTAPQTPVADDAAAEVATKAAPEPDTAADEAKVDKADKKAEKAAKKAEQKAAKAAKADADAAEHPRSAALGWLGLVGEVLLGVLIGGGLFWGFTVLWKQYVYFALILAVLVIFAIVTFAYVLRKRDLPTTLLALAVGLIVTIGPLVMLV
ncbi:hypothetical protein MUG78_03735 [Gordonia alkaliphila]|uniref:hypothetical protein n=1 Tax=Gordonia alkaliphila TaxID=1053547 RepID=UPI001FF12A3F|nr:hypothetical protein [Gordonia alkaliphila]MCK0438598.1 hypothetical protein [Gordonia alkaliphila]